MIVIHQRKPFNMSVFIMHRLLLLFYDCFEINPLWLHIFTLFFCIYYDNSGENSAAKYWNEIHILNLHITYAWESTIFRTAIQHIYKYFQQLGYNSVYYHGKGIGSEMKCATWNFSIAIHTWLTQKAHIKFT